MSAAAKKALIVFSISTVVIAVVLCVIPVDLFNGEVVWNINGQQITREQNLSLSYFFGIGVEEVQWKYVDSFRLTAQGWLLVFIIIVGIPGLIAYRMYLKATTSKESEE
ncbi:MAG: hypothetical protein Crog4KO_21670 [Crocinitomicaceae bacterium]